MSYIGELRVNWRPLAAAALGMGAGLSLNAYMGSIFAPHVIAEFGWTRSQYALIGVTGLLVFITLPFCGRLVDLYGVRRVAAVGVVGYPLGFLLFSQTDGHIGTFIAIAAIQTFLGASTTSAVYSRIVAQHFERARGLALAVAISGPALVGAVASPFFAAYISSHGWRSGYQAAALFTLLLGIVALLLMPAHDVTKQEAAPRRAGRDYRAIVRSPAFWIIIAGTILCNLAHVVTASQLNLVLMDSHASVSTAAALISTFAAGVIGGRFISGVALDRFPAYLVAAIGMSLPGVGMLLLASSFDSTFALAGAMILIGAATGAEGDILAYLVVRTFGIAIYGSVLGLVSAALGLASAGGAGLLSLTLKFSEGFSLFLALNGFAIFVGGALFLLLGRYQLVDTPGESDR